MLEITRSDPLCRGVTHPVGLSGSPACAPSRHANRHAPGASRTNLRRANPPRGTLHACRCVRIEQCSDTPRRSVSTGWHDQNGARPASQSQETSPMRRLLTCFLHDRPPPLQRDSEGTARSPEHVHPAGACSAAATSTVANLRQSASRGIRGAGQGAACDARCQGVVGSGNRRHCP